MQQVDDPPSLPVGTEVSAKYKGAFCEAKVSKVVRNIKVKVAYKQGLGSGIVSDDAIKAAPGQLRVGTVIEVRHPDRKEYVEATITKIQDCSQYTVVFDDGDITTLRRTALCLKSGRHFNESETLDQLPLTHPEHFGNPVVGGRRGRRRGQLNDGSSDDDDESDAKEVVNEKEENIGKVVCVETESKKKDKEKWFPALVVAPTAQVSKQATVRIRVKDEYLVRSFKDGRYYTVPKKEANEFTREMSTKQDGPAIQAALEFLDSSVLPAHWDRDSLFGLSNLTSDDDGEIDSDSSDDEPHEEKDLFVAQLYKYMDDRGTPLNKVPSIQSRDVDLYRLFRAVQKRGGYNRVTAKNQWKLIAVRLGFTPCTLSVMNLVKQAYKKFLQPYGDFHRKLGCSMLMPSRNSNRSKGRSLVRANSVASPKPADTSKMESISKLAVANQTAAALASSSSSTSSAAAAAAASTSAAASTPARAASTASQSAAEESENTSESSVVVEPVKKQRKASAASSGKVKSLVEKYEEKTTEKSSSAAAAAAASTSSAAAAAASAATSSSSASASNANSSSSSASASTASTTAAAAANTAAANATTAAAAAAAAAASASSKDAEADVPLSKIRAAAVTRNSIDKEPNAGGSNAASKAAAEAQRSRDVSPTAASAAATTTSSAAAAATAAATATTTAATATTTSSTTTTTATTTGAATASTTAAASSATGGSSATTTSTTTATAAAATTTTTAATTTSAGGTAAATAAAGASTSSSSASSSTSKKEKHQQRKQVEKGDEKRGKRKKDETSVEKIDTGDFIVGIGDKLKVNYHEKKSPSSHGSTYEAKVIEISVQRGVPMYLVHYTGWNNRYDEWVPRERIAENLTKGSKQKTRTISTSSANSGSGGNSAQAAGSSSAAAGGSGGGGGGGSNGNGGNGNAATAGSGLQPKDGPGKSAGGAATVGGSSEQQHQQQQQPPGGGSLQSLGKTPASTPATPTLTSSKRGRGRSDSMPPRSTTPSSVASNSSRTKSPAAAASQSQLKQKRATRTLPHATSSSSSNQHQPRRISASASVSANVSDASMPSDTDTDSDEPVRRPKRLNAKEQQQLQQQQSFASKSAKATAAMAKKVASTRLARNSGSDDSEDEEDEMPPSKQQAQSTAQQPSTPVQRQRAGNRALSSGSAATTTAAAAAAATTAAASTAAAASKGRDYDLSEIRSELKGFQPQLLDRKDAANIKSEPGEANTTATSATATVAAGKQEPKTGSSTEQSSETDSYLDEDSQSSEKVDYRIKSKSSLEKTKLEPSETIIKKEQAEQLPIKHETSAGDSKPSAFKAEPKEEPQSKPFHSGADIKPTTASTSSSLLIAPARFTASGSKCTSVIVEKPLRKTEAAGGGATTTSTAAAAAAGATGSSISIFKKMELLKKGSPVAAQLESPAVCSPSSSSSSSSSFCSSSNSSAITTVSVSSSSATRSLPDMSKLEISSGITATASAVAGKESKYSSGNSGANSSSSNINVGSSNIASGIKLLSSDVYEFKDTEPFEFEKRISPMTSMVVGGGSSSGGVAASVIAGATPTSSGSSNVAGNFDTQRKHNLKLSAMMQSMADVTTTTTTTGAAASAAATTATATTATSTVAVAAAAAAASGFVATPCKLKKRGSPLKEATLTAPDNKPKMPKLEQQQQQQPATATTSGSSVKATPAKVPPTTATAATVGVTQLTPGHATPFDVLRKSPSFNLNITALNEELAQTVQETTRVLTDALQPPTTPATPPANAATVGATIVATPTAGVVAVSPKLSTPPQAMGVAKTTQQQQQQSIVGSPFMETRNVFELSTSNEGSGYSSGESNKDNKLEKLENVKILLAGKPGPFDLDAVKYEQKPSSIADKVLKAISQKKEEVEQSKSKSQADTTSSSSSNAAEKETEPATQQQQQQQPQPSPQTLPQAANLKQLELSSLLNLQLISEPLKILTPGVLSDLNHRTSSSNSPETKSILDASLTAKNSELTETIQKLECAIQQRKTPVAGQSLASSTAGTPPVTATAPQSFSDESMDSTDSEQRLVIEDVMVEEPSIISDLKSPMSTASDSLSGSAPVKLEATGSSKQQLSGVAAPIALKPMPRLLSRTPTAGGAAAVAAAAAAATPPGTISPIMPIYVPIVLPEIPASVVVALRHSPSAAGGSSSGISSPASPKTEPTKVPPSPLAVADVDATAASSTAQQQLLLKPCPAQLSPMQQMDASVVTAGAELAKGNSLFSTTTTTSSSAAVASSPLPRPFVLQPVKEKDMPMHVSPAASSPLISDPSHNEAAINLLCEETIPGSPAPIYSTKDEPIVASSSSSNVIATAIPTTPAAAVAVSSASSVLSISGITPLTPEPAPRSPRATHVQPTISAAVATAAPAATTAAATTGAATAGAAASAPSPSRSSPESPASQDDSSEETGSSSMLSAAKKYAESVLESNTSLAGRRKRPRTKASDANASNATATASSSSAAAGQLSSSEMQKRRRQHLSNMRKTTATTAGSDTDDNSDNVVTTQRQSGRQQLLPQAQQQQLQQQQQQQQHQQLQQQQQQLQQQQQVVVTASGVRPCPYNFLVELDPSLSAEQCILILRKQIQDLRKAYNSIKGELAVIDRRRKKLRRREREKKQHQQLQGGQQGKVCT